MTDLVLISQVLRGVDRGGLTLDDPPGVPRLSAIDLLCADEPDRIYTYATIGGQQDFGPVTATVPLVRDGFEPNGLPRLFAAEVDPMTGRPVLNTGPGHCFLPTATRVNDPQTGEILPQFQFQGPTSICATLEVGLVVADVPALSPWPMITLVVLLSGAALGLLLRRRHHRTV